MALSGEPLLLRPKDVADRLALGRSKTYALIATGEIPSIRIGRSVRIEARVLNEWIAARRHAGENV